MSCRALPLGSASLLGVATLLLLLASDLLKHGGHKRLAGACSLTQIVRWQS